MYSSCITITPQLGNIRFTGRRHGSLPGLVKTWLMLVCNLCTLGGMAGLSTHVQAAPALVAASPVNAASGVSPSTRVVFTFSEAMKPQQNILWFDSTGTSFTDISYSWSDDQRLLTCTRQDGWPANTTINWILSGSIKPFIDGFESRTGEPLQQSQDNNGHFTTSSGGGSLPGEVVTNSCGIVTTNYPKNTFAVQLQASYEQTGTGTPLPLAGDGFEAFLFTASAVMNGGGSADSINFRTPDDTLITLDAFRNNFIRFDSSNDLTGLQAAYPPGDYFFTIEGGNKLPPSVLAVLPSTPMPVIHVSNYTEAQAIDETQPFTLRWDPLGITGASVLTATIRTLSDDEVLKSPDPGCPGALRGTSTAWVIPADTLTSNRTYKVTLELNVIGRQADYGNDTVVVSGQYVTTTLNIKAGRTVVPVRPFSITTIESLGNDQLRFVVSPTVEGKEYRLEQQNILGFPVWTATGISVVASGTISELSYTLPARNSPAFFRVVSP